MKSLHNLKLKTFKAAATNTKKSVETTWQHVACADLKCNICYKETHNKNSHGPIGPNENRMLINHLDINRKLFPCNSKIGMTTKILIRTYKAILS